MSSNRANASARQRRAGEAAPQQQSYSNNSKTRFVQQSQEPPQPPMNPKLSVSDAIALITLRLGRVEQIVSTYDPNMVAGGASASGNNGANYDENMRMVDQQVFNSIVSRLDTLEKNQKVLIEKQKSQPVQTVQASSTTVTPTIQETTVVKDISEEKIAPVKENIKSLTTELSEVKNLLLKLQTYTMETNKKLVDIVFDDNIPQMLNQSFMFGNMSSTNMFDANGGQCDFKLTDDITILDSDNNQGESDVMESDIIHSEVVEELKSTNLRDLVKQELMNETCGDAV